MNQTLKQRAIKREVLKASYEAGACHIGSALSCVSILVDLFYKTLKEEDIFLFGKASGVAAYYAVLADKGYFPKTKLAYYLKNYPLVNKEVPGVVHSFGSCGHGLSVAAGVALGDRTKKVYVLLSDGELDEGSTYEAALFARHHKLNNLYVIVDNNEFQALGKTKDILDLKTAFEFFKKTLPNCRIIKTIKGAGVDFMRADNSWHYRNLTEELYQQAKCQI